MNWFPKKNSDKNGPVRIERRTEVELEKAIIDLQKRSYELVSKGIINNQDNSYQQYRTDQLTANLRSNRKRTLDPVDAVRYFAVMKRITS